MGIRRRATIRQVHSSVETEVSRGTCCWNRFASKYIIVYRCSWFYMFYFLPSVRESQWSGQWSRWQTTTKFGMSGQNQHVFPTNMVYFRWLRASQSVVFAVHVTPGRHPHRRGAEGIPGTERLPRPAPRPGAAGGLSGAAEISEPARVPGAAVAAEGAGSSPWLWTWSTLNLEGMRKRFDAWPFGSSSSLSCTFRGMEHTQVYACIACMQRGYTDRYL